MVPFIATLLMAGVLAPTPEQAKTITKLEDRLMAPCCYSQTIRVHMSTEAAQMRDEVTSMVLAGKSETEIVNYYRAKYGETILVVPDGMAGRFVYGTPICVFVLASGLLVVGIVKVTRSFSFPRLERSAIAANAVNEGLIARIREDLREDN
jgi:cytochrome c-type biogenesis protein CcmH